MDQLKFRLLGPFEVSSGRRMILSGGGKRRAVLAVLLLSANEAVSIERLIDALWNKAGTPAVDATNTSPDGGLAVHGFAEHGHGVEGGSTKSKGVVGTSADFQGVYGHSDNNAGVVGESATWVGVYGKAKGGAGTIGVMGEARADSDGVTGNGTGVYGASTDGDGVVGSGRRGVVGRSPDFRACMATATPTPA